ncbi:MAG: hypothetical protein M3Z66_14075 [Chloroflexota bacterium]|nr:hypothetical protein [Chloroflexota bacterium]
MELRDRLYQAADQLQATQPPRATIQPFEAELFTEHWVIHGKLSSPESRLSDQLNGFLPALDLDVDYIADVRSGAREDCGCGTGYVTKASILLAIPIAEPARPQQTDNAAWRPTAKRACWAGVGAYRVRGWIHTENGRDPHMALRLLDKNYPPVTEVTITLPNGSTREVPTVLVNRSRLDVLTLELAG